MKTLFVLSSDRTRHPLLLHLTTPPPPPLQSNPPSLVGIRPRNKKASSCAETSYSICAGADLLEKAAEAAHALTKEAEKAADVETRFNELKELGPFPDDFSVLRDGMPASTSTRSLPSLQPHPLSFTATFQFPTSSGHTIPSFYINLSHVYCLSGVR